MIRRFAALYDAHVGYETVGGHKRPLHDPRAIDVTMQFLSDFKPHDVFLMGDILDCGPVSHHNKGKARKVEAGRLVADAELTRKLILDPIEKIVGRDATLRYAVGNHEDWLEDFVDENPAVEGLTDIRDLLKLRSKWDVIPQGHGFAYHKLYFVHGDTIRGGENCAKRAVIDYGRNIRFGHYHTYQVWTLTSPVDAEVARTGIACPCLCSKDAGYNERRPNKWVQGFEYGYVEEGGVFNDNIAIIIRGKAVIEGKVYTG